MKCCQGTKNDFLSDKNLEKIEEY